MLSSCPALLAEEHIMVGTYRLPVSSFCDTLDPSGVRRILENTLPSHFRVNSDYEWGPYREYMRASRININVRQVFPKGFDPDIVVGAV
jgi:hypothetical protein